MTADVPRRLYPRTEGQRVQNVARTHAAQSLGGSTAAARPVQNTTPTPTIYRPNTGSVDPATLPRLTAGYRSDPTEMAAAGAVYFLTPDFMDESAGGTTIVANDDGITLFQPGVYAVNLFLNVTGLAAADGACVIRLFCDVSEPFGTGFDVGARGGDGVTSRASLPSTSRTYFVTGSGSAGTLLPGIAWENLDAVNITNIVAEVQVQRVV